MNKPEAHGVQFANLYMAKLVDLQRVIIGSNKEQISDHVTLISDTALRSMFNKLTHINSNHELVDLRFNQTVNSSETTASNKKEELNNEKLSQEDTTINAKETEKQENDGDSYESLKRKRNGRKPNS